MSIEVKKNELKKQILSEISRLENSIKADNDMLEGIKDQGVNSYVLSQINKVEERNNNRITEIDRLNKRKIELEKGNLDCELYKLLKQEEINRDEHKKTIVQKRLENKEQKAEKSKISQGFYKNNLKADRETRFTKKDIARSYNYYNKIIDTIPDYINRNLEEMPNNKGYIFRDVYLYGKLPEEKNKPTTMFEKRKGLLIIHEWTEYTYKIYHKKDKERKVLISSEQRKYINANLDNNII